MSKPSNITYDETISCPLCQQNKTELFYSDQQREYWRCELCDLIFVPPHFFLSEAAEKARYQHHQNDPADQNYCAFLSRIIPPMLPRLAANASGLDFGCGPFPGEKSALALLFEQAGFLMTVYDPFFSPDTTPLKQTYDFIVTTEAIEHFYRPFDELSKLFNLLMPNGTLGIMTRRHDSTDDFANWFYKDDLSHVCFFSKQSFRWIAKRWSADLEFMDNDIIVLHT